MRIRARPSRRRLDRITLNLASMIDVTFLLLAYFMLTMVLTAREDHLSPTLQTQRDTLSGEASDFQPQIIEVVVLEGAPAYRLGTQVLRTREELAGALEGLPTEVGVFVKVYDGVNVGYAVAAIQLARDAGFQQVTYVPSS
ncbi:MAG: biopolymer transporter ExbD [Planctomycetota bacterium]|nr:biopolymer transporter ExbD [Planctomycetota bacterium]